MALIKCTECGKEMSDKAVNCPNCGAPIITNSNDASKAKPVREKKKGSCLRTVLIVIGIFFIIGMIGSFSGGNDDHVSSTDTPDAFVSENSENIENPEENVSVKTEEDINDSEKISLNDSSIDNNIPAEYKSALNRANSYSEIMHMSKDGIYDQLTSEYGDQFTEDAAQYAVDNMTADWNANALAKAKEYSDSMYMSKAGIYDQLISEYGEKFTPEEAQYAVDHVDADWNANALQKARDYQNLMDMSPAAIRDQLTSEYGEKFTPEEATYAVDNLN